LLDVTIVAIVAIAVSNYRCIRWITLLLDYTTSALDRHWLSYNLVLISTSTLFTIPRNRLVLHSVCLWAFG